MIDKHTIDKLKDYWKQLQDFIRSDRNYTVMLVPHDGKAIEKLPLDTSEVRDVYHKAYKTAFYMVCTFIGLLVISAFFVFVGIKQEVELLHFYKTKDAQEKELKELHELTEKVKHDLATLVKIEKQMKAQMAEAGMNVEELTEEEKKAKLSLSGKGGFSIGRSTDMTYITKENKHLHAYIQNEIKVWNKLKNNFDNENYRLSVTPTGWPADSYYVTSPFGGRENPFDDSYEYHPGIDIAADYGDPVYASGAGEVVYSGWYYGYGNYVKIAHDYGYSTAYGHMSEIAVREGTEVKKGQIIGYAGSTGYSTGPHIHFEVMRYGQQVDPEDVK